MRDEMLQRVFGEDPPPSKKKEEDVQLVQDDLFEDWEEATTDEIIALPGNSGIMTSPPQKDKKKATSKPKKKINRTKTTRKSKIKTSDTSQALTSAWTLTDAEIKDLEEYLDSLPPSTSTDTSLPYDFEYEYDHDELD